MYTVEVTDGFLIKCQTRHRKFERAIAKAEEHRDSIVYGTVTLYKDGHLYGVEVDDIEYADGGPLCPWGDYVAA